MSVNNVCRLCAKPLSVTVDLFSSNIPIMIESLTSIKVEKTDGLPKNSCESCVADLYTAYAVKKRIIESDKKLKDSLVQPEVVIKGDDEVKIENENTESKINERVIKEKEVKENEKEVKENKKVEDEMKDGIKEEKKEDTDYEDFVNDLMDCSTSDSIESDDDSDSSWEEMKRKSKGPRKKPPPKKRAVIDVDNIDDINIEDFMVIDYGDKKAPREKRATNKKVNPCNPKATSKRKRNTRSKATTSKPKQKVAKSKYNKTVKKNKKNSDNEKIKTEESDKSDGSDKSDNEQDDSEENEDNEQVDIKPDGVLVIENGELEDLQRYVLSLSKPMRQQNEVNEDDFEVLTDPNDIVEKIPGTQPADYMCKICEIKIEHTRMYLHRNKHMKARCKICNIITRSDNMKKHVLSHKAGPQVCDICGSLHKSIEGLRTHLFNFHSDRKNYKCDECGEEFRLNGRLWDHKRKAHSHGVRPYVCDICGKGFWDSHTIKKHKKLVHLNLREYQCDFCKRGYSTRYALKTHRRQHTGELPYVCEHCCEGFRQAVSLRTHMKSKHNIIMPVNKPGYTYSQQARKAEKDAEAREKQNIIETEQEKGEPQKSDIE